MCHACVGVHKVESLSRKRWLYWKIAMASGELRNAHLQSYDARKQLRDVTPALLLCGKLHCIRVGLRGNSVFMVSFPLNHVVGCHISLFLTLKSELKSVAGCNKRCNLQIY